MTGILEPVTSPGLYQSEAYSALCFQSGHCRMVVDIEGFHCDMYMTRSGRVFAVWSTCALDKAGGLAEAVEIEEDDFIPAWTNTPGYDIIAAHELAANGYYIYDDGNKVMLFVIEHDDSITIKYSGRSLDDANTALGTENR
ncbi:hypothetical protein L0F63_006399 [Massospora cicadina]|nr:hypothetical protein L0F63_006399 [Massospora cicadina]